MPDNIEFNRHVCSRLGRRIRIPVVSSFSVENEIRDWCDDAVDKPGGQQATGAPTRRIFFAGAGAADNQEKCCPLE
eukprot:scaffold396635_cov39-Prasinocladus_malaysianus.AAC.1